MPIAHPVHRDVEITRVVDSLETARASARALHQDLLAYLVELALTEAYDVIDKGKIGVAPDAILNTQPNR